MCGYASGAMASLPDSAGGKTVAFALRSLKTAVFFEQQLRTVGELLDEGNEIVGHKIVRDGTTGACVDLALDAEFAGARYFIPTSPQPEPLSIMHIGQFANDLALCDGKPDADGGYAYAGGASYAEASSASNLLVLVQRLERDPERPSVLLPSRPISTLSRDVTFANRAPMEVGCEYGPNYWEQAAAAA